MVTHTGCVSSLWFVPPCSPNRDPIHLYYSSFVSIHFGTEITNTFIHIPVIPSKTIPDSRPKWAKCRPVFRPKRLKYIYILRGGTYLYGLHKGAPPRDIYSRGTLDQNAFQHFNDLSFCIRLLCYTYTIYKYL